MPQARNPLAKLILQMQSALRTIPAAAAYQVPFSSYGVKRNPNRQADNSVNQSPLMNKSNQGDPSAGGPMSSILDLRTIGFWLKLALGAATVGKAVTVQPTNVTGVTIHYASSDCTSGAGTLEYTNAGTTLEWTPQGGAAGTAVDVGEGGVFTLEADGGGKSIRVSVNAAQLPAGDESDADITVHATLKAHAFPHNTALRPAALLEMQHADISKYYRTIGAMVNSLGWNVIENEQNISLDLLAAYQVEPVPESAFDANPTVLAAVRACAGGGQVSNGGTGLGTIVGGDISIGNNLVAYPCADGLEGAGHIDNGELVLAGNIRTLFTGADAYALARAGTSARMRCVSTGLSGSNTFSLAVDIWGVELGENEPVREGRSGLFADLNWKAHKSDYDPIVVLVNDVASY